MWLMLSLWIIGVKVVVSFKITWKDSTYEIEIKWPYSFDEFRSLSEDLS